MGMFKNLFVQSDRSEIELFEVKDDANLLEIKLKDTDSVPEIYYKGQRLDKIPRGLVDISYHWHTRSYDTNGQNKIHIEYYDSPNTKLMKENTPLSLAEGTTVPIRLRFKSETAEGGYGKHDYLATIEDRVNGIVSIVLEDNILGYVGKVEGSVYIDFPNDLSLDTAGRFTFYIKRSPIDDSMPELEDYYFNGFSQNIDKIEKILADRKLEIDQKIAESETQIDGKLKDTNDKITKANQDIAALNTNIDKANDCIDQTNQQIGNLGKLKKMYSNSIDFWDYDYSGNP
ncbi:BppU family phage baseplate upper protein, partial [Enterococcus hirae]